MSLQPGILMDAFAAIILIFSVIWGAKKGFTRTCFSFVQWFLCIGAALMLCTPVKELLITHTAMDDAIHNYILGRVNTTIEDSVPYQSVPDLFSHWIHQGSNGFLYGTAAQLTDIALTILSFLLIILLIKMLCLLILRLFSKDYHDGFIGFFDSVLGFLFGFVRGVLLLLILFIWLFPLLCLLPAGISIPVKTALDQSMFASILYDENLLLILLRDLFS